jgi:hypothetical protein
LGTSVSVSRKGRQFGWRDIYGCAAMVVCLMLFIGNAQAQQFTVRNFPIPISVDGEHVRSNVFLQFEMKDYGMPFSKFAGMHLDPREAVFAELVRAMQHNDAKAVEKVLAPQKPRKPEPDEKGGTVLMPEMTPEKNAVDVTTVYRAAFGNLENVDVIAQVLVGSKSLFIWDAKMIGRPRRRAFSVEPDGPTRLVAREVTAANPVDILILSILEDGFKDPMAYAAVADPHLRYRQPLAIEGKNKTAHEVALLFNGQPVDFDAFAETPPTDPLLLFYWNVFTAFKAHKNNEFLAGHSAKSQAKLQQWWKTFTPEAESAYYKSITNGRWVKFVMDGDPVYIVFYGQKKGADWIVGSLSYQYVLKNPQTQHYLIANVLSQGFFDDVIGRNTLFDQRVLKPPVVPKKATNTK